jgi:sugar phosphate isomerase/epimerase
MTSPQQALSRRNFCRQTAFLGAALGVKNSAFSKEAKPNPALPLGFDNFSIRALGWKAEQLIEYASKQKVDALLFSDLNVYESHDKGYLSEIGQESKKQGILLQAGTGGICPTSAKFNKNHGSAEEHLRLLIRVAKEVGSTVARCYLGSSKDRMGEKGIQFHIESTVKTLKKVSKEALDAGVKIAVENHAGDMHSRELADLIERAGPDFVGATLDTGNATWTLEDPVETFRNLAPYTVSSGIRDSMIWPSENGARVQWTAMGEGCVDLKTIFTEWAERCPDVPVQLETISGFSKEFPYLQSQFWPPYTTIRADDFSRFILLARKGHQIKPFSPPAGVDRKKAQQEYQLAELERSLNFCRNELGLGRKSS